MSRTLSPSRYTPSESHSSAREEARCDRTNRRRSRSFDENENPSRNRRWGHLVGPLLAFALIEHAPASPAEPEDIGRPCLRVCHFRQRTQEHEFPVCPLTGATILPDSPWHHPVASTIPWVCTLQAVSMYFIKRTSDLGLDGRLIWCVVLCL